MTDQFSDGAAYEQLMGQWSRKVGLQFLDWCKVAPSAHWLDVGCGNGAFTEEIAAHASPAAVIGIDPVPGQIEFARSRKAWTATTFQVGDAQHLPFAAQHFDVAVMALVIAFVPEPAKAVAEMRRVVRPGGLVASYMWDLPHGGVPLSPVSAGLKAMGIERVNPPSPQASRMDVMEAMWRDAGLRGVETRRLEIDVQFENFEEFWNSTTLPVGPMGQTIKALSAERLAELKARLRETVPVRPDGSVRYPAFANAVKGLV
jgi:SAM-dependent methyltransferase